MAGVQRKLVHKQFNSPMGLYSQENVKATLNRELKAFGADGIEIDEQITKPLNLANSAVLRAVEEEEQQVKCGDFQPLSRQSRSRRRGDAVEQSPHHALHQNLLDQIKTQYLSHQHDVTIDRDTVLRINRMSTRRHLHKRDHSWPPVEPESPLEHGSELAIIQGSITPSPTHSIEALREKFNSPTRIVELSPREVRNQRQQLEGKISKSSSNLIKPKSETSLLDQEQPQTAQLKGFSAPETKAADADIGLVAPKCEYYEQLTQQRPSTPSTLKPNTAPYRPRLKRQSYSLDRGRARKRAVALSGAAATELPPPKPRNGGGGGATASAPSTPRVQRRSIKLATELRICYDGDSEEEQQPKATASYDIDLETLPLPALPSTSRGKAATAATATATSLPRKVSAVIDSLALKQQQQLALALATASAPRQVSDVGHRIPVAVAVSAEPATAAAHSGQLEARVQQMYDDACSYLQQDQHQQDITSNMTPSPANQDETPATYVSATSGIKLQRQESIRKPAAIPTPPPLPPPPMRAKRSEEQKARRQGVVYSDSSTQAQQHEAHLEIAQLEAKYAHIQQSITEHLRQIDAYMENAKTALQRSVQATPTPSTPPPERPKTPIQPLSEPWDMFASRQSPILATENPLQAILRQIYCRAAGIQLQPPKEQEPIETVETVALPEENVPIVERALEDLHKIALALDSDEQALHVLQVEHKTTPTAVQAEHVIIVEDEQEPEEEDEEDAADKDCSLDYRHVSDVIANYEQLSAASEIATKQHETQLSTGKERTVKDEARNQFRKLAEAVEVQARKEREAKEWVQKKMVRKQQWEEKVKELKEKEEEEKEQQLKREKELREQELQERKEKEQKEQAKKEKELKEQEQRAIEQLEKKEQQLKEKELKQQELKKLVELMERQLKEQQQKEEQVKAQQLKEEQQVKEQQLREQQLKEKEVREQQLKVQQLKQEELKEQQLKEQKLKEEQQLREQQTKEKEPQQDAVETSSCSHETTSIHDVSNGTWCSVCNECRDSPHGWGKLTKADQWRFDNLQNESLPNYKSTYEVRSPYVSRQISWEETQQAQPEQQPEQQPKQQLQRQRSEIEIITTPAAITASLAPDTREWQLSRSPSPSPLRKYPAPLIDTAQRCSSPFGLNPVQSRALTPTPTPIPLEAKYTHVPQLEGHNIGLLVRTATEPLQLSMSASSSMLAATPPATPRCTSQPPPFEFLMQHGLGPQNDFKSIAADHSEEQTQSTRDFSINRSFDNVSPRPYIGIEGYKRVAWPPASEERIVREFTPQPQQSPAPGSGGYYQQQHQQQHQQQPTAAAAAAPSASSLNAAPAQQQYQAPSSDNYQQQQPQQQQPQQPAPQHWQQQQHQQQQPPQQSQYQAPYQTSPYQQQQPQPQQNYAQQNGGANYAQPQYNSYSQPQQLQPQLQQQQQQLPYSQDQTDQQQSYRGASPGIITLRKEAPVSQKPAPVYTSQPAAVSYQGGGKLRGDLKWPPPEYKEAAVRENEERRLLALGPVCRPRRVNRDYTTFFAKNQLNCTYPSYKVPPGTQHMFA
ncbi:plectin isoform X6 [Drosophila nasuta]|uniref:plectin isoform X6 n=1 Tax=Drosophila nasuta TaxID=42062 RepID=UPI00295E2367|nr:plectin isoform X6 [Drosophila nasuta]